MIILHGRFIYFLNDSLSVNLRQLENVTVMKKLYAEFINIHWYTLLGYELKGSPDRTHLIF